MYYATPGTYTNRYFICVCPFCVLERGAYRNVTPDLGLQFPKILKLTDLKMFSCHVTLFCRHCLLGSEYIYFWLSEYLGLLTKKSFWNMNIICVEVYWNLKINKGWLYFYDIWTIAISKMRMHSSRMRTARSLTVCRSRSIWGGACMACMPPTCHACPPTMHAPLPHTPPCHACPPITHAPLPCTPPCHARPPSVDRHTPVKT